MKYLTILLYQKNIKLYSVIKKDKLKYCKYEENQITVYSCTITNDSKCR